MVLALFSVRIILTEQLMLRAFEIFVFYKVFSKLKIQTRNSKSSGISALSTKAIVDFCNAWYNAPKPFNAYSFLLLFCFPIVPIEAPWIRVSLAKPGIREHFRRAFTFVKFSEWFEPTTETVSCLLVSCTGPCFRSLPLFCWQNRKSERRNRGERGWGWEWSTFSNSCGGSLDAFH